MSMDGGDMRGRSNLFMPRSASKQDVATKMYPPAAAAVVLGWPSIYI